MKPAVALLILSLLPLPKPLPAQALDPPYLSEMPSVERLLREIKGKDADELAARRMGTFLQMRSIIQDMASYRYYQNKLTADEQRLIAMYYGAYWDVAKTDPKYRIFTALQSYDISVDYRLELFEKYFSPAFRAKYEEVDATFRRNMAARAKADTQSMLAARAEIAEYQNKGNKLAGEQRGIRRCMEAGLSEPQCLSEGVGKSFKDNFMGGMDLPFLSTPKVRGLRMGGAFPKTGSNSVDLKFYAEQVVLTCQDLVPEAYQYAVAVQQGQAAITIQTTPRPLIMVLRPDGRLAGPAAIDINGRVQTGVQMGTRTWSDGRTEPISRPVYEPRTRRCGAVLLASSGPSPDPVTMNTAGSMIFGLFMGEGGNKPPKPSEPGLRIAGEYGSQAAFDLEFRAEGVIVGCREAAVLRQYRVNPTPNGVVVAVQNGAAPFNLTMGGDGRMTGNGSVRVDGRQVTNVVEGRVTYAPRSDTCPVGVLGSTTAGGSAVAAAPAADATPPARPLPGAAPGNAVLELRGTVQTAGGIVPMNEEHILLLNEDPGKILTEAGFKAAPGKSLFETFAACDASNANCGKGMQGILGHVVAKAQTDDEGKASFAGVAPASYYLLVVAADYGPKTFVYNVKVRLDAGKNTVMLTPKNAIP